MLEKKEPPKDDGKDALTPRERWAVRIVWLLFGVLCCVPLFVAAEMVGTHPNIPTQVFIFAALSFPIFCIVSVVASIFLASAGHDRASWVVLALPVPSLIILALAYALG
jgi:lipopolysaccharide export LptBFGC system permease protein LptF